MKRFHIIAGLVIAVSAFTALPCLVGASVIYSTGFEPSEGYTIGETVYGQQGWGGDNVSQSVISDQQTTSDAQQTPPADEYDVAWTGDSYLRWYLTSGFVGRHDLDTSSPPTPDHYLTIGFDGAMITDNAHTGLTGDFLLILDDGGGETEQVLASYRRANGRGSRHTGSYLRDPGGTIWAGWWTGTETINTTWPWEDSLRADFEFIVTSTGVEGSLSPIDTSPRYWAAGGSLTNASFSYTFASAIDLTNVIAIAFRGNTSGVNVIWMIDNLEVAWAVPEPSTVMLLALGGGLLLHVRRRRR